MTIESFSSSKNNNRPIVILLKPTPMEDRADSKGMNGLGGQAVSLSSLGMPMSSNLKFAGLPTKDCCSAPGNLFEMM